VKFISKRNKEIIESLFRDGERKKKHPRKERKEITLIDHFGV